MNRLWVRLSIVMSGLILIFTVLPFFTFLFFPRPDFKDDRITSRRPGIARPFFSPWHDLPESLLRSIVLAGAVGIAGGVAASRLLAAPVTKLANAAQAIGAGDLSVRVELNHSSKEIDALAVAFNKMAADLQHAAELRNNLMADVSHELRTPLTVLEGNLRAALDHVYELDEEQIANLYEQTRHLIRLVSELRELTLAEAAQLHLNQEALDLRLLVQETAAVFEPLAEEKAVRLVVHLPPALPTVNADSARMRQVLHNLLANALRHSSGGGQITLAAAQTAGRVRLTVEDTGDGIDPQHLEHLFDRFYRTDPSRSRETGGSGLGLAIVKAIIEAHGGEVTASSPGLGKGTKFTIFLPTAA